MPGLDRLGAEAVRIEALRVFPQGFMAVQDIGADKDNSSLTDVVARDLVLTRRLTVHEGNGRIETHGFLDKAPRMDELGHLVRGDLTVVEMLIGLGAQFFGRLRKFTQQIGRPCEGHGGRFVPRREES